MKSIFSSLLALALFFTFADTAAADDATAILGTWKAATAELGGKPLPPMVVTNMVLKMAPGRWEVTVDGNPDKGTYKLDPTTKTKLMDITGTEGPNAGRNIPAIYELSGDKLKICYGLKGSPRPTEFKSATGTQQYLVVYQRKKT